MTMLSYAWPTEDDLTISISVEGPAEDPFVDSYYYARSLQSNDLKATLTDLNGVLLDPPSYTSGSPFLEDSPMSTMSDSSSLGSGFPSPSSDISSLWSFSSSDDLTAEVENATVSPRDIMGDTFLSYLPHFANADNGLSIDPLFEDESHKHDLIALDQVEPEVQSEVYLMTSSALFGAQNRSDLRVEIPNSSSYTPVINTNPPSPFLTPLLDTPHNIPLPASPELSPPSPQSPALSPPLVCSPPPQSSIGRTNHSRKLRSSSSQVPPSPDRLLCDQEPPTDVQAHQLIDRAAFRQIIVFLKDLPEFKHWDFEADGLPELSKKVVGSKKTREASESRRTQNSGFWCTIPGCGSSITKKHNLRHHIISHFLPHGTLKCACGQKFTHKCSLLRHQKGKNCAALAKGESRRRRPRRI